MLKMNVHLLAGRENIAGMNISRFIHALHRQRYRLMVMIRLYLNMYLKRKNFSFFKNRYLTLNPFNHYLKSLYQLKSF